jgi:hypothetical protein
VVNSAKVRRFFRSMVGIVGQPLESTSTLQWHLSEQRRRQAHPEDQPSTQLRQVSLQSLSRLLQHRKSELLVGGQTQGITVVADLPMGAPGPSLDVPLMMSGEVACSSHKPKRGLLCHPGKPLRGIWLQREQALLGTDHHVVPLLAILNARDDMHRLARGLGCRTRAGSRGGGLRWTRSRPGLRGQSRRAGGRVLLKQVGELRHLLLQRSDLRL